MTDILIGLSFGFKIMQIMAEFWLPFSLEIFDNHLSFLPFDKSDPLQLRSAYYLFQFLALKFIIDHGNSQKICQLVQEEIKRS